jgi:hypothetical protein
MTSRNSDLLNIRPQVLNAQVNEKTSDEERFQNKTLRPIIKLQNDLLIAVFMHYIKKRKNVFYELSLNRRMDYIEHAIHKDMKFRNTIKGIVIGQFTLEEYLIYTKNSSALNKRITNLVKERLQSQIQVFETDHTLV